MPKPYFDDGDALDAATMEPEAAPSCCQVDCDALPECRVYWPGGEPKLMCFGHAIKAQNIGFYVGCNIPVEPLTPEETAAVLEYVRRTSGLQP